MTSFSRGDVVLVPFPFSELSGMKRRPALIISNDEYNRRNRAVVIAQITSRMDALPRPGDQRLVEWEKAGLLAPSLLRCHLATVKETLIIRKLGKLSAGDMSSVSNRLAVVLGLSATSRD
jgi:mRNA interferase MazF